MTFKYSWTTKSLPRDMAKKIGKIYESGEDIFDYLDPESIYVENAHPGETTLEFSLDYHPFGTAIFESSFKKEFSYTITFGTKRPFDKKIYVVGPLKGPKWPFKD